MSYSSFSNDRSGCEIVDDNGTSSISVADSWSVVDMKKYSDASFSGCGEVFTFAAADWF